MFLKTLRIKLNQKGTIKNKQYYYVMDDDTKPHVVILECMMLVMGRKKPTAKTIHGGMLMIPKDWETSNTPI
jgi:hypothetical protein